MLFRSQEDYIFNLEDSTLAELMIFAKKVAKAIEVNIPCKRIGVAVIGLEVLHTHIHLVPINSVNDLSFKNERVDVTSEEMTDLALKISNSVEL